MPHAPPDFAALLQQAQQADDEALARLCELQRVALRTEAQRRLGPEVDATTLLRLVNQTLQEAQRRFPQFSGDSAAQWRSWLELLLSEQMAAGAEREPEATLMGAPGTIGAAAKTVGAEDATISPTLMPGALTVSKSAGATHFDRPPATVRGNDQATIDPHAAVPPAESTPADPNATLDAPSTRGEGAKPVDHTLDHASTGRRATHQTFAPHAFGDYDLLSPIAKGGMGVVYKARQRKLNRIVAVKMILAGQFADEQSISRFYTEAAAAARLRHPNIVAIHEVGEHAGQHFFSMDYIEGRSLAELIRQQPLGAAVAAGYVQKLAQTMQYAHDQGILHRDLKPSNVLLDRQGQPLITDFGLAKQTSADSQLTASGAILGTPSYMPPEQAAGEGDRATVRSDVYSLGAILYELLSGRPPFLGSSPFETMRQVLEDEPAALRVVNAQVPRDLETICHKCLQKAPASRYASAQELADELGRFERGEPILARPVGTVERLLRWRRRNPVVAAIGGVAVLSLIAALAATSIGIVQVSAARDEALKAYGLSEISGRDARAVVNDLFTEVSEDTLLNEPGMQPLRKKLLDKALDYYRRFLQQRRGDAAVSDELAATHFRVGRIIEEIESPEAALESYEDAREVQTRLLERTPQDAKRITALAATVNAIGRAQQRLLKYDQAVAAYDEAVTLRTKLIQIDGKGAEPHRLLANTLMNQGVLARERGQRDEALRKFSEAQDLRRRTLGRGVADSRLEGDLGNGSYNLGVLSQSAGDLTAAGQHYEDAIAVFERLSGKDPQNQSHRLRLAAAYRVLGDVLGLEGKETQAIERFHKALEHSEELAAQNPTVNSYQLDVARLWLQVGLLHDSLKNNDEAYNAYDQATQVLERLTFVAPELPQARRDLAIVLRLTGAFGTAEEGQAKYSRSQQLLTALVAEFPDKADYKQQLELTERELTKVVPSPDEQPPAPEK